jgi:hypothetical protein
MKVNLNWIKSSYIFPWVIIFILLSVFSRQDGATNELSRFAAMRAMVEQQTFQIDSYKDWTVDWAQPENGHYYSNKAPAPMLIAFPVFYLLEKITQFDRKEIKNEDGLRLKPVTATPRTVVSLLHQLLPFCLVVLAMFNLLKKYQPSYNAFNVAALAVLFGNTAIIFMNFYFGHGFTAVCLLSTYYFYLKEDHFKVGLSYGLTLLSDYSTALLLPIFLLMYIWKYKKDISWIKGFVLGGIIPGILWLWYHTICFGSPLKIPNMFQNPRFQDVKQEGESLWGIFNLSFPIKILGELLVGKYRSILMTQPWIYVVLSFTPFYILKNKNNLLVKQLYFLCSVGLLLLLLMNVHFGGWHGGSTSGPRYMSAIFPLFGFLLFLTYDFYSKIPRLILWGSLIFSLAFRAMVYGSTALAPEDVSLWEGLFNMMVNTNDGKGIRLAILFSSALIIGAYIQLRKRNEIERS